MGWGEVIASAHPDVPVGERAWGWFPYSTHLKVKAGDVSASKFTDVSLHRAEYAPVYAQFDRASANPIYEEAREDQDSLLRGLFMTSWLVEDFLQVNDFFDAKACLITSASSKTSIALGHSVRKRGELAGIGITSGRNVVFCESLGCYDTVVAYEDAASLDAAQAVVMVDMAGSAKDTSGSSGARISSSRGIREARAPGWLRSRSSRIAWRFDDSLRSWRTTALRGTWSVRSAF